MLHRVQEASLLLKRSKYLSFCSWIDILQTDGYFRGYSTIVIQCATHYPISTTQVWALRNSTVLRAFWACLSFIIPIDNIWLQHSNPYFSLNMSTSNGKLEPKHLFRKNMLTDSNLPFYYDEQNEFMADCASSQYNMGVVLSYIMEEGSE